MATPSSPAITLVVMTRNRVDELLPTLQRLTALPEQPPVIVVDNGSTDGTTAAVTARFPQVDVVRLRENAGVVARNLAVERATTPYVAFNDDDSWWAPGSLARAAELFEANPTLGALTAHVVVQPHGTDDPTSLEMRDTPVLGTPDVPGLPVLGFLACATAVRRSAFQEVGGFEPRFHFGGEEELLATDLAAAGWEVRYHAELIVHHEASSRRDDDWRRTRGVRNTLWYLWLRRPATAALRRSWALLTDAHPRSAVSGLAQAVAGLPWILKERAVVSEALEADLGRLERQQRESGTRQYAA